MRGNAQERIPFGAKVLCRGWKVSLAGPELANAIARHRPTWCSPEPFYEPGEHVMCDPIEGLGERDLHAMANAPLMDAQRLFLPAGKLSMDEYRRRVAADVAALSVLSGSEGEE